MKFTVNLLSTFRGPTRGVGRVMLLDETAGKCVKDNICSTAQNLIKLLQQNRRRQPTSS